MLLHPISEKSRVWRCGEYSLPLGAKTYVMAILNATPDSFSGDGLARGGETDVARVVETARRLIEEGADILDIGGESTRPGAQKVSLEEEARRVLPLVDALARLGVPLSIDTTKSVIARRAVQSGASIINDISGATADPEMLRVLARENCGVVLMHRRGESQKMRWSEKPDDATKYHTSAAPEISEKNAALEKVTSASIDKNRDAALQNKARVLAAREIQNGGDATRDDIIVEVLACWREQLNATRAAGIDDARICFDAGFGFGKSVEENLEIVRRGGELSAFGFPTLSATSRKSTIARVLAQDDSPEAAPESDARLFGTAALTALAIAGGCDIVRVHDVEAMAQIAKLCDATLRR